MLVKMVLPFLKEKMRNRIIITDDSQDLLKLIEADQLPSEFPMGKAQYNHQLYIQTELTKVSTAQMLMPQETLAFFGSANSPQPAVPEGTESLVSNEIARALVNQRKITIQMLNERIRVRKESLGENPSPSYYDVSQLIKTKRGRLSVDGALIDSLYLSQPNQSEAPSFVILPSDANLSNAEIASQINENMMSQWTSLHEKQDIQDL